MSPPAFICQAGVFKLNCVVLMLLNAGEGCGCRGVELLGCRGGRGGLSRCLLLTKYVASTRGVFGFATGGRTNNAIYISIYPI